MNSRSNTKTTTPFRSAGRAVFVAGAAQEESLARLEYLRDHGGGWATVIGPPGIGKSALLTEIARRGRRRGENVATVFWEPASCGDLCTLLADEWRLGIAVDCHDAELRRRLEDHVCGLTALQRPTWVLIDDCEELTADMQREIRWLTGFAARRQAPLTIVIECRNEGGEFALAADLRLALWAWDAAECSRYIAECCRAARTESRFSRDGIAALAKRSGGVPGQAAKLAEWAWLAAEAEGEQQISADLVEAVAEELSPAPQRRTSYEMSAAYGAW